MGRKSKLTPVLQKQIVKLLEQGNNIEDVCSQVGITSRTYYNWRERGEVVDKLLDSVDELPEEELLYFQFFQATTRALQNAKVKAVSAIYGAISGQKTVEKRTLVFKEKRFHTGEDGKHEPYDYERTTTSTKTIQHAPDARTAIEYLKRRYPDEWSDRLRIDVDPGLLKELESLANNAKVTLTDLVTALIAELKDSESLGTNSA